MLDLHPRIISYLSEGRLGTRCLFKDSMDLTITDLYKGSIKPNILATSSEAEYCTALITEGTFKVPKSQIDAQCPRKSQETVIDKMNNKMFFQSDCVRDVLDP